MSLDNMVKTEWRKAIFYSDAHFGKEDLECLSILYEYIANNKSSIEKVIDNGDIIDNENMSDFPVDPYNKLTSQEQFDMYSKHVKLMQTLGNFDFYLMAGNHDKARHTNKKNLNKGLASLRCTQFENVVRESFDRYDVKSKYTLCDGKERIKLTKNNYVTFFHGDPRLTAYLKGGVTGPRRTAEMYPNQDWLICGHGHWWQIISRNIEDKLYVMLPMMANKKKMAESYLNHHPYGNGFGVMHYNVKKDKAYFEPITIENGLAYIDGKEYNGKKLKKKYKSLLSKIKEKF